ncbi:MAG: flagellar hook-associated protein FlgK [Acetivibrionales bacterium]|jgi:flagellar hook-associated protein 1 FlgK
MAVNFAGYYIGMSGMYVNQQGLNVTGHNITNINTPGYVRQQAMIKASSYQTQPAKYGVWQFGLGSDIQSIRQIRHMFLDDIYRKENTTLGYWEARNKTFQDIQAILGEPMEDGLQSMMNQFWDSWQELSKTPDSLAVRALVRQRGENLANYINHIGNQLDKLQDDLNSEIKVRINEVNTILKDIAKLNVIIAKNEVTGDSANDYRDQRNNLVDRLTNLVNCDVTEMQDGQLDILVGGYMLVSKGIFSEIVAEEKQKGYGFYVPKIKGTNIEIPLSNGAIKGLMESRGEVPGAEGALENGTPDIKADIVFAVDISGDAAYLADVKANIESYVDELRKRGIDYNLRLITFGDGVAVNQNYGTDYASLISDIPLYGNGDAGNNFSGTGGVIEALEGISDWTGSNRYAMVFTGESIEGDGGASVADEAPYVDALKAIGVKTSVITNTGFYEEGDPAGGGEIGWRSIAEGTGGHLYNLNTSSEDYAGMMAGIASDVNTDVSNKISCIETTSNILSDLRKRLNALVNIMMREVNYLHRSGMTMDNPPLNGEDFFTVINSGLPLEMGNIKINDNLMDLNKIVTSVGSDNGDNIIAKQIANLRYKSVMMDVTGVVDLDDYYQSIILSVGNGGAEAERIANNQRKLVESADNYRQSIMGVSMDEEMTNMIKFKYAYNASSRTVSIIDEMIDTVINRMGTAGR